MKYLFIINPVAGKNNKVTNYVQKIQKLGKKLKLQYTIHISESGEGIRKYLETFCRDELDPIRVYALGGDGTLSHVMNGCVAYEQVEIGVIPLGTGNDFIRNFTEKEDVYKSLEKQIMGQSNRMDLIAFDGEYCVNMVNIGLDASVAMDMPRFKKLPLVSRKGAYNLSLFYNLLKRLGRYMEIYADDKLIYNGEVALCAIGNGSSCGGGFYLTPDAKVDDGWLDVTYVLVPPKVVLPTILKHLAEGVQFEMMPTKRYMKKIRCKKVRIVTKKKMALVNDGELYTIEDCTFEVVEKVVSFIRPQ
ncbi:MAG: YegS/Rv2252/BmrU family lipid kinase [Eubacteriales bacterium]